MENAIHLMRHGKVENPRNVRYGRIPGFGLSRLGRAQAAQAAEFLRTLERPITRIVSSPLERAVETATIVQQALGLPAIETDPRLLEAESIFDGRHRWAPLAPWNWPRMWNPFRPSWGEAFGSVSSRMLAAISEHRAAPGPVLLVSHQAPIWIARTALRRAGSPPWTEKVRCTQASVTSLEFAGDQYRSDRYWAPS